MQELIKSIEKKQMAKQPAVYGPGDTISVSSGLKKVTRKEFSCFRVLLFRSAEPALVPQ